MMLTPAEIIGSSLITLLFVLLQLTVNLLDRNEFTPLFSKSTFTATVQEDIPPGTSVIEGKAVALFQTWIVSPVC